jgi:hypothetical protein
VFIVTDMDLAFVISTLFEIFPEAEVVISFMLDIY